MVIKKAQEQQKEVQIETGTTILKGILNLPADAKGIVVFAHGSGSGRLSPRNHLVARFLNDGNVATLLVDLLTEKEEEIDTVTRELRFNIPFLANRLAKVTEWMESYPSAHHLTVGYFGASTGAAAALIAAAEHGPKIRAVVSRGGRPDLAGHVLPRIQCPTLLIVGGNDFGVIELNQHSYDLLACKKKLEVIPGATHLFEEPGTLEQVARMATLWFQEHL